MPVQEEGHSGLSMIDLKVDGDFEERVFVLYGPNSNFVVGVVFDISSRESISKILSEFVGNELSEFAKEAIIGNFPTTLKVKNQA